MKKRLFLLITCFLLFSSLIIFFIHQNIQLSEIIKKEEEKKKLAKEVKRLLKQLKEQKEKDSSTDDLPWHLNWKGATLSLIVCSIITVPIGKILAKNFSNCGIFAVEIIIFIILFFGLSPFLLATFKYKNKSYLKRYYLLRQSYWKPFVCVVLSWLFFIILLLLFYDTLFEKTDNGYQDDNLIVVIPVYIIYIDDVDLNARLNAINKDYF